MKIINIAKIKGVRGFALAEIMVAAVVMVIAFAGILMTYIKCLELNEMSQNKSIATRAAKTRMEQINNSDFAQLVANFNQVAFFEPAFNGAGVSYIDNTNPDLVRITVSFCWKQKNGLLIGEDTNLNGVLNAGEDKNGNGMIDSPVQLVTFRYDQ